MWLSHDARKMAGELEALGIIVAENRYLALEHALLYFYPNHVRGVVKHCLKPSRKHPGVGSKLVLAQKQGWAYFDQSVWQLLVPRPASHRNGRPIPRLPPEALLVWDYAQRALLLCDTDQEDMARLLRDIPKFLIDGQLAFDDVREAVRVCLRQDVRTPRYLYGVLRRQAGEKQGRRRERAKRIGEQEARLWKPETGPLEEERRAGLVEDWKTRAPQMETLRSLRTYVASGAGKRGGKGGLPAGGGTSSL